MSAEQWSVCPKCGLVRVVADTRYGLLHQHRCPWCDLAPRRLTDEELAAALAYERAAGAALTSRSNVSMTKEDGRIVFTEWGSKQKERKSAHFQPHRPRSR
jgi:hypothetical protein